MLVKASLWFMELEQPSFEQSGFVMAIWGAASLIFNFYAKSGRAWGPQVEWENVGQNDYLANQKDNYYRGRKRPYRRHYQNINQNSMNQEEGDA